MKKITLLLVIIFTFLFSNTSWGEWTYVTKDVDGEQKYYYDKDRVRKSGKYHYFWILQDYIKPSEWGDLSSTRYIQLECSIFRHKSLKFQTYNKSMGEGKMTTDMTPPDEWVYPKPDSISEYMNNKICEENNSNKQKDVLFMGEVNGQMGWVENTDRSYGKYVGEIKNGKPNGQGKLTRNDGEEMEGDWKDGVLHGKGTRTFPVGLKYVGEYKNGIRHGQGTQVHPYGWKYIGEWNNGDMWNGIRYDKNGKIEYKYVKGKIK